VANDLAYPFVPKSNRHLRAGQFWAVPLNDGRFTCGRVMAPKSSISPRVMFMAGLMDWVGNQPPTEDNLAGRRVLSQGSAHVKTITETGASILGCRPLDLEDLHPEDEDTADTWGIEYIARLAEHLLT
jgi:hypothetical protein